MTRLDLRTAIGSYGHTAPLKDGTVGSAMFGMDHVEISPTPVIFRRMVRGLEFDVAEMALATYLCSRAHGKRFFGIPIFLTRDFYHSMLTYNIRSGIESPGDLEGKKVGVRSYTFTPGVWTRGLLQSEYGVDLGAVTWVLSGDEHVEEYEAPSNVVSSESDDLAEMLLSGEIDAAIGAGPIDSADVRPMFAEAEKADAAWHRKTGLYPISHLLVAKDSALEENPGLAEELFRVFDEAKSLDVERRRAGESSDPYDATQRRLGEIVGADPIPYGYESSRETLDRFIAFNAEQGVIPEKVDSAELFPSETLGLG